MADPTLSKPGARALPNVRRRRDAKALGLPVYFTGKPCGQGHIAERRTANGQCMECRRIEFRAWRGDNTDKARAATKAWRESNIEYARGKDRRRWADNREREAARDAAYRAANVEKVRARKLAYREANKEKLIEWQRAYHAANPLIGTVAAHNRRARVRAVGGRHTAADIEALRVAQGDLCLACNADFSVTGFHIDHMIPVSRGGGNGPDNLCLLCPTCNLRKFTRTLEEFFAMSGRGS